MVEKKGIPFFIAKNKKQNIYGGQTHDRKKENFYGR